MAALHDVVRAGKVRYLGASPSVPIRGWASPRTVHWLVACSPVPGTQRPTTHTPGIAEQSGGSREDDNDWDVVTNRTTSTTPSPPWT